MRAEPLRRDEKRGGVVRFREFIENPKLLTRFLNSQVGRPWDEVYSEIRSNPDSRRGIGPSILRKIERLIATDCFIADRQVLRPGWFGPYPPRDLYVHPKSGLLCRPRPVSHKRPAPEITRVVIDELHWYQKLGGLWYRLDHKIDRTTWLGVTREDVTQTSKKQCSKKELARIAKSVETGRGAYYEEARAGKTSWVPVEPKNSPRRPVRRQLR
jgi:hypothetical protein